MKNVLASILFLVLVSSQPAQAASWQQYATPADAGYDATALASARDHAEKVQSAAVFVVADGRVLAAWGAVDRKLELHSVRKSLYAALWGIAESRGLVKLDATLADLGVDDLRGLSAQEKNARLVDLLQARSGVYHPSAYSPSDMEEKLPERGSHAPGTFWYYNNWDFNVGGALLERVTGKPLGILFDEWIARPIGMEDYAPSDVFAMREPGVSKWPALTFRMSARDLARFGQLWLNGGSWDGKRIVPAHWIERASAPVSDAGEPGQGYGMMWWTYAKGSLNAERYPHASQVRAIAGRGTGGQFVAIVPERQLVFIHRGDTDHARSVNGRDVWTILDRVLGARQERPKRSKPSRLTAVRAEPFRDTLPELVWPAAIALERSDMESLAGSYELRPGMDARVFIDDGRLYAFMPGKGEAELFARNREEFYIRVDPTARVRFDRDADGKVTAVRVSLGQREIVGRRK